MVSAALTQEGAVESLGARGLWAQHWSQGLRKSPQEGTGSQDEIQSAHLPRVRAVPCALLQLPGSLLQGPKHPAHLGLREAFSPLHLNHHTERCSRVLVPPAARLHAEDSTFSGHTWSGVSVVPLQAAHLPTRSPLLALSWQVRNCTGVHTGVCISRGRTGLTKGRARALSRSAAPQEAGRGRKHFLPAEPHSKAALLTQDGPPVGTVLDFGLPKLRHEQTSRFVVSGHSGDRKEMWIWVPGWGATVANM